MSIYIDFHVLQTVPPSCVNRDDTGSPKTAVYGGAVRARVSSQAWKHAMREDFKSLFTAEDRAIRTKAVTDMIIAEMRKIDDTLDDAMYPGKAKAALEAAGIALDKENDKAKALFFISNRQAKALAECALTLDFKSKDAKKQCENALKDNPSIEIALFGRMVAGATTLNCDAAAQVAHAISTHAVHNEYDYFTACDDLQKEDNAGAGHLGTVEFNSSTLYRYANVNATELAKTIGTEKVAEAIAKFGQAFIHSMPTGRENTFANRTLPDAVYVTLRSDQPVNLCGAFEQPVKPSHEGFAVPSEKKLASYAKTVYEKFAVRPVAEWCVSSEFGTSVKSCTLPDLLTELETAIASVIGEE